MTLEVGKTYIDTMEESDTLGQKFLCVEIITVPMNFGYIMKNLSDGDVSKYQGYCWEEVI